jgi:hypothetical protein
MSGSYYAPSGSPAQATTTSSGNDAADGFSQVPDTTTTP